MRWGANRHGLARQSPSFDRTDASVDSILHRQTAMWGQLWHPSRCISTTPRPYMTIIVNGDVGGGAASVLRLYCGRKGVMNHFVDNCNGWCVEVVRRVGGTRDQARPRRGPMLLSEAVGTLNGGGWSDLCGVVYPNDGGLSGGPFFTVVWQ